MNFVPRLIVIAIFMLPGLTLAQGDLVAAAIGSLTGLVEDENGNMVEPQSAIEATVNVQDNGGGDITATISGTGACTGGLGIHFIFTATYNAQENSFSGLYTDVPGASPDMTISFVNTGGFNWSAAISGTAPSNTGLRAYDLSFNFEIPESSVFAGNQLPDNLVFGGSLDGTTSVQVPINVPQAGINQTLDINVDMTGSWDAVAVPQIDGSSIFTGSASGSFNSNSVQLNANIPGLGVQVIDVSFSGNFGGSLFPIDESTVAFQGAWVASGAGQTFGGDIAITIDIQDTSTFPYFFDGIFSLPTGMPLFPTIEIPFAISGNFPLNLN